VGIVSLAHGSVFFPRPERQARFPAPAITLG
jgi:hypothetical protein